MKIFSVHRSMTIGMAIVLVLLLQSFLERVSQQTSWHSDSYNLSASSSVMFLKIDAGTVMQIYWLWLSSP